MNLGSDFSSIKAPERKEFKMAPCKGYEMVILSVEDGVSKKGNPMITLSLDISDGEYTGFFGKYPLKSWNVYGTEQQKGFLKQLLDTIIAENKAMFPEEDPFANGTFDEQRLVGCKIGGVLKWDQYNGKYNLRLHYLTDVESALKAKEIAKPEAKASDDPIVGSDTAKAWGFTS